MRLRYTPSYATCRRAGLFTLKWSIKVLVAAVVSVILASQIVGMFTEVIQLTTSSKEGYERRKRNAFLAFAALIFGLIMTGALFFSSVIICEVVTVIRKCDRDLLVD